MRTLITTKEKKIDFAQPRLLQFTCPNEGAFLMPGTAEILALTPTDLVRTTQEYLNESAEVCRQLSYNSLGKNAGLLPLYYSLASGLTVSSYPELVGPTDPEIAGLSCASDDGPVILQGGKSCSKDDEPGLDLRGLLGLEKDYPIFGKLYLRACHLRFAWRCIQAGQLATDLHLLISSQNLALPERSATMPGLTQQDCQVVDEAGQTPIGTITNLPLISDAELKNLVAVAEMACSASYISGHQVLAALHHFVRSTPIGELRDLGIGVEPLQELICRSRDNQANVEVKLSWQEEDRAYGLVVGVDNNNYHNRQWLPLPRKIIVLLAQTGRELETCLSNLLVQAHKYKIDELAMSAEQDLGSY